MRVISQDGTFDIPYEQVVIQSFKGDIYFLNKNLTGIDDLIDDIIVAKYSTEEKAQKAMEELRCAYMCHTLVKTGQMPPDGIGEKLTMGLGGVFQFPAEEELE